MTNKTDRYNTSAFEDKDVMEKELRKIQNKINDLKHTINTLEDDVFTFIVRTQATCIRRIKDDKKGN
jgi:predicted translin family RNA/ssDNA-binding protein